MTYKKKKQNKIKIWPANKSSAGQKTEIVKNNKMVQQCSVVWPNKKNNNNPWNFDEISEKTTLCCLTNGWNSIYRRNFTEIWRKVDLIPQFSFLKQILKNIWEKSLIFPYKFIETIYIKSKIYNQMIFYCLTNFIIIKVISKEYSSCTFLIFLLKFFL